jgi:NADPH:quinone reductase-like Zn-dependent oxidoreductase
MKVLKTLISVLIKNEFVGINASDVNYTNGKYIPGLKPPFDCGFEGLGKIVLVGDNIKNLKIGDIVSYNSKLFIYLNRIWSI